MGVPWGCVGKVWKVTVGYLYSSIVNRQSSIGLYELSYTIVLLGNAGGIGPDPASSDQTGARSQTRVSNSDVSAQDQQKDHSLSETAPFALASASDPGAHLAGAG